LDRLIEKTQSSVDKMRANLYEHDWDATTKASLDQKNDELEYLLERKNEYTDAHTTMESLHTHIKHWGEFYGLLNEDERRQLYHATVRRISIDFESETANIAWTFSRSQGLLVLVIFLGERGR